MTFADLKDAFLSNLPTELEAFVDDTVLGLWLNEGRTRLGYKRSLQATITWTAGDRTVALPTDLFSVAQIIADSGYSLPSFVVHGTTLHFLDSEGANADGSASLLYLGRVPKITDVQASLLTEEGNEAILSFARYRLFDKIASSRANYRRYATLLGANAVGVDDLESIAATHLGDFQAAQDSLPADEAATFYGD